MFAKYMKNACSKKKYIYAHIISKMNMEATGIEETHKYYFI